MYEIFGLNLSDDKGKYKDLEIKFDYYFEL